MFMVPCFIDSSNLRCGLKDAHGNVDSFDATFVSSSHVQCVLPALPSELLSGGTVLRSVEVSND